MIHEVCERCERDCKKPYTHWSGCMPDEEYCEKFKLNVQAAIEQAYREGQRHPDEKEWVNREELEKAFQKVSDDRNTAIIPIPRAQHMVRTHGLKSRRAMHR
jgi:hypothetical protein